VEEKLDEALVLVPTDDFPVRAFQKEAMIDI